MRRPGQASVAVDFDSSVPVSISELPLPGNARATRLAAAPDGTVVFTARQEGVLGRATFPDTATILAPVGALPYGVAVAPNGDIWITKGGSPLVERRNASGALLQTVNLPVNGPVRDIAVDANGVAWVGSANLSVVARIQGNALSLLQVPSPSVDGVVVGTDGQVRLSFVSSPRLGVMNAGGGLTAQIPLPVPPADLTRGAGSDIWFLAAGGFAVGRVTTGGSVVITNVPAGGPEGTLVMRSDGRIWFSQPDLGRLGRVDAMGVFTVVPLPAGTRPLGLAVDGAGHLWVADANNARLLIVGL
jgi:virginiamycin B lyase